MNETSLGILLSISNISILAANAAIFIIYGYTACRSPHIFGLWLYIAAFPFYILLSALNLLMSFGGKPLFMVVPKEIFRTVYFVSLAASPLGAILGVAGAVLIARYILTKENET